ncbi:MAG: hypothetical protein V3T83_04700, partial [Acidobacteriota bacterium]
MGSLSPLPSSPDSFLSRTHHAQAQPVLDRALTVLLEELGVECLDTLKLLSRLRDSNLTSEQIEDVLVELAV